MAQAGACWRDAGVARRAGHVARVLRCAGCHGLRKVCERALAKMRGLAGKESGVFGRDAWHGRSRAGEEAGGATGCGGSRAWGRVGLVLRGLASMCTVRSRSDDALTLEVNTC